MIVAIILLCLGVATSSLFIASKVINYSFKTIILKTIASLFFVALGAYLVAITPCHTLFRTFVLLGLIFGLLGDVLLGFKYITTKTKKMWIMLGLFAFAFGHISYLVALFLEFYVPGQVLYAILPFALALILTSFYLIVAHKVDIHFGKKLLPFCIFYLLCLTSMVSTSLFMAVLHNFTSKTGILSFIGAVFFCASDFMLTGSYFKKGDRSKTYLAIYSICYYSAQFLIAFSLFFL